MPFFSIEIPPAFSLGKVFLVLFLVQTQKRKIRIAPTKRNTKMQPSFITSLFMVLAVSLMVSLRLDIARVTSSIFTIHCQFKKLEKFTGRYFRVFIPRIFCSFILDGFNAGSNFLLSGVNQMFPRFNENQCIDTYTITCVFIKNSKWYHHACAFSTTTDKIYSWSRC